MSKMGDLTAAVRQYERTKAAHEMLSSAASLASRADAGSLILNAFGNLSDALDSLTTELGEAVQLATAAAQSVYTIQVDGHPLEVPVGWTIKFMPGKAELLNAGYNCIGDIWEPRGFDAWQNSLSDALHFTRRDALYSLIRGLSK